MELLTASFLLVFISTPYFPTCLTSTRKLSSPLPVIGWGSPGNSLGWQSLPASTLTGGSGLLSAVQDSTSNQNISIQATGQGMNINLYSNLEGVAGTELGVSGGLANVNSSGSGLATAGIDETLVSTILIPVSQFELEMDGLDTVDIDVSSVALGWENVNADVSQGAQVVTGNNVPAAVGGWTKQI
ncbi:unnamed protein product [Orchesella dallaii]|uniref:Uncharacterized protein n=1 Tax=Orchesella dallaii TaxID=48710 RepID=A0ABP1Q3P0_9HEXA